MASKSVLHVRNIQYLVLSVWFLQWNKYCWISLQGHDTTYINVLTLQLYCTYLIDLFHCVPSLHMFLWNTFPYILPEILLSSSFAPTQSLALSSLSYGISSWLNWVYLRYCSLWASLTYIFWKPEMLLFQFWRTDKWINIM